MTRLPRLLHAAGFVALVLLVVSAPAAAARKPTHGERSAIVAAFHGYVAMPSSPAARDNRIVSLRVSSLDPRYAAARVESKSAGPAEMVFHRGTFGWFVVEFGSQLGCDAAPAAVLRDLGIGCTPPDGVAWIFDCGPLVSEPSSLVIACADANFRLADLRWHAWGSRTATATGNAVVNDCTPNCAAGRFHSYRVAVSAGTLRTCGRARYYARLTVDFPGARPAGMKRRVVTPLGC